jgi:gluconolactonase
MNVEIRDERFRSMVGSDVEIERLASGFDFIEGPIWHPRAQHLIFSDMPGNHMRRWSARDGITTFRKPSNMANGNAYDRAGRIVTCEHATSRVTRTGLDGRIEVLATHWQGQELNSPNDVVVRSDGAIYFTDPTFGRMEYYGLPREPELSFRGVYRLEPDTRKLALLADDFGQPNGLCFSLDEKRLFVNDTERAHIRVFDVNADGTLANSRIWAAPEGAGEGAADGMKVDSAGHLFCTGPGGIHVFAPDATSLGVIQMPEGVANFTWGDADLRSLFVCASTSLYRVRVEVAGQPAF